MKKYDGKHRKKIGRKKRELMFWRNSRAAAMRMSPRQMLGMMHNLRDPLLSAKQDS